VMLMFLQYTINFYTQLNNIKAVLGRNRNEIAAVHLTKRYCFSFQLQLHGVTHSEKY